jgi:hypothetical protein
MKKFVYTIMIFFCIGLLGSHANAEFKRGFNDYNSAAETYSASKVFGSSDLSGNEGEGELRVCIPKKPSEPNAPVGGGLGIIALCSGVYILFQSRKKNEKTV